MHHYLKTSLELIRISHVYLFILDVFLIKKVKTTVLQPDAETGYFGIILYCRIDDLNIVLFIKVFTRKNVWNCISIHPHRCEYAN